MGKLWREKLVLYPRKPQKISFFRDRFDVRPWWILGLDTNGWRLGRIWCGYTPMLSGTGGGWLQLGLCLRIVSKEFGWSWDIMGTQCFEIPSWTNAEGRPRHSSDSSQGVQTHRTFKVGELPSGTFDIGMEIRYGSPWLVPKEKDLHISTHLGFSTYLASSFAQPVAINHGICPLGWFPSHLWFPKGRAFESATGSRALERVRNAGWTKAGW